MTTPSVRIRIDIDRETETFVAFMNNERFPRHRAFALGMYPELAEALAQRGAVSETDVVRLFVYETYKKHAVALRAIVSRGEEELSAHAGAILAELAQLMEYPWSRNHPGFDVVLTVLPFSPFKSATTIFCSVARKLRGHGSRKGDENHEILPVFTHQVSHLMLRDILTYGHRYGLLDHYGWATEHFLEEVFAPILMNHPPLKKLIGIKDYFGNPDLEHLNVTDGEGVENIVSYYQRFFETFRTEGVPFVRIVKAIAESLESAERALLKKRRLWDAHTIPLTRDIALLREYEEPVRIH